MRSEICVATRIRPPNAANASPPSHSGLVPAINITTNAVAAIKAVVPRSTSPSTSAAGALMIDKRNNEFRQHVAIGFFMSGKPGGEEKDRRDFCKLRWLKCNRAVTDPPARSVDAHSYVRDVAKRQSSQRYREPNPPRFLPELIVHERRKNARNKSDPNPNRLTFNEKINVSMAVACVGARAKEHHDANDQQSQDC